MSLSQLLINLCSIEKVTYTKDAAGGPVPKYSVLSADVPCSIQSASGQTIFKFAQRQIFITHRIYFDRDVGIHRGYRIKDEATRQYYVIHSYQQAAGRNVLWFADATLQLDS